MPNRVAKTSTFEYAVVAALRAHQLIRGCTPQMPGIHKPTIMAQLEVSAGKIVKLSDPVADPEA